ncbi:putative DNA-binding protein [Escherichia coli]|uniref:Putative DNA-binding protein n=4 Tax=Escherichia coli TaxID=562 RepID=A0A376ZY82_ECOLX|nr:putative DNA-binding protein [Escherichia coli]
MIVGRNINASVNFYWLIKFCLLNLYTEFLSVCVHELTIWRINTVLQNGTNPPVFAGSGRMFWRSAGRQRPGQKNGLRIALLNVDYVTSFELPFRLLLTRTPQLIAALREEWGISQKNVVFNDKRFGCVYSLKASLSGVPDTYRYHLSHRIRRVVGNENTSLPYQQVAREVKAPRERLKYALEAGLLVTALDGLFWFGSQRIAADVLRLRKAGMPVVTTTVEVHDNLTGTTRKVPAYHL